MYKSDITYQSCEIIWKVLTYVCTMAVKIKNI